MTDWDQWYACPQCPALLGGACFDLSSDGPQALPPRYREVPHSGRKPRTAVVPVPPLPGPRPQPPAKTAPAARRRARRTESTAAAWRALAEKRRRNA